MQIKISTISFDIKGGMLSVGSIKFYNNSTKSYDFIIVPKPAENPQVAAQLQAILTPEAILSLQNALSGQVTLGTEPFVTQTGKTYQRLNSIAPANLNVMASIQPQNVMPQQPMMQQPTVQPMIQQPMIQQPIQQPAVQPTIPPVPPVVSNTDATIDIDKIVG